ncbi:MAG TPA: hypothetical protein VF329_07000 [Gammaproteobacteria bacterium]
MTTLSATFSLLGLIGYLFSRRLCERRPITAIVLMTLSLVVGASLATLTKENGALLPLFVLIIETTLLSRPTMPRFRRLWSVWFAVVLAAPAVALLVYLALRVDYSESTVLMRGFSSADRLLTEVRVLWEYLFRAFLPISSTLGPFHDDYPVFRDWLDASSLIAVGGWITVIAAAILSRRRAPLLSFAVGWYLVGHSLESTTLPLELYFEHRNYLPLVGPVFALVSGANAVRVSRPLINAGLAAYSLVLATVLFSTTSLWGRPALAAEMWFKQHPDSTRAVQYVAQQLYRAGDLSGLSRVLDRFAEAHPQSASTAVQALFYSCLSGRDETSYPKRLRSIRARLPEAKFEYSMFEAVRQLYRAASNGECKTLDRESVYELAAAIAAQPAFRSVPIMRHNLHLLMSEEGFARRDLDMTMRHIEAALAANYTMTTLIRAVQMLASAGLYSTAQHFVEEAYAHQPRNPFRAVRWNEQLAQLEQAIKVAAND